MSDDLDLSMDDIPVPQAARDDHADAFDYDLAFRIGFVGVGQGGSRIAETFHQMGYRRVAAINTAAQDLAKIEIPDRNKLDLGGGGAGKDPARAAAIADEKDEDIYDVLKASWGNQVDVALICLGTGGGTGAGASSKVLEVARRLLADTSPEARIGVIAALPKDSEGQQPAKNTLWTVNWLREEQLSPVIVLDNQRIQELYDPSTSQEYPVANTSIARLFHLFNRLAAQDSEHTTFDRADFVQLLDSGVVAFGAQKLHEYGEAEISRGIRQQLRSNILASVDLQKGRQAALLFVCGDDVYDTIKASTLDHAYDMLSRLLADDSAIFRGVYRGSGTGLNALAMVGALPWPEDRLDELARLGGKSAPPKE